MRPVDIMIHVRRRLNDSDRLILDNSLRKLTGVVAPWFAPRLHKVIVVYYNPGMTNANTLLSAVRRLGYEASLVAM